MEKHKFNIFPQIGKEDYNRLESDILNHGYNPTFPIWVYQNAIIDGWQRYQICEKHTITPVFKEFEGNDKEAMQFVMQSNKRRNLTSSQWASIAVSSEEIMKELEDQAKERQGQRNDLKKERQHSGINSTKFETGKSTEKAAQLFNTNPKYIQTAKKLKTENPEEFERVKTGEKTLSRVIKEKQEETKPTQINYNPFFARTNSLLINAGDNIQKIIQGDHIPKTLRDYANIDAINWGLYRLVRLAGEAGVDIKQVWDKMAARHGIKIETPVHMRIPKEFKDKIKSKKENDNTETVDYQEIE